MGGLRVNQTAGKSKTQIWRVEIRDEIQTDGRAGTSKAKWKLVREQDEK
jgi:hypothetical protein